MVTVGEECKEAALEPDTQDTGPAKRDCLAGPGPANK